MTLAEIGSLAAALISAISIWVHVRDKRFDQMDKRFDRLEGDIKDIRGDMKDIRGDISDIRERVSAIEMSTIFLQVNPNPTPASRSDIAKKMWERRKAKQIQKKASDGS
jgi:hypothetical protein